MSDYIAKVCHLFLPKCRHIKGMWEISFDKIKQLVRNNYMLKEINNLL